MHDAAVDAGTVVSTESTYKYHMQVQENLSASSTTDPSLQQPHTGPFKLLLKPRVRPTSTTSTASEHSVSDNHTNADQTPMPPAKPMDSTLSDVTG